MYINKIRKRKCLIVGIIQSYIGVFFVISGFLGTLNMIFDFKEVRSVWGMFVFMDVSGAILLYSGIRNLIATKSCVLFDNVFQKSEGRVVTMKELSVGTHMSEADTLKHVQLLLGKQCLERVSVNMEGDAPVIILESDAPKKKRHRTEYIVVRCPNCGGSCTVKRGSIANCEYCGGRVREN